MGLLLPFSFGLMRTILENVIVQFVEAMHWGKSGGKMGWVSDFKKRECICLALRRQIKLAHSLGNCLTFAVTKLTAA